MKSIILCADDFGQNEDISLGILDLVSKKRLSAVSCMTNLPGWHSHGPALREMAADVAVGLHFNLTFGKPLTAAPSLSQQGSFFSLPALLLRCYVHHITLAEVEQELIAQLEQFQKIMGRLPDFIDGHQHVHQFPIIRDALLNVYQKTFTEQRPYIRQTLTQQGPYAKKRWVINHTGAKILHQQLQQANIPHNSEFAGIYDFDPTLYYGDLFQKFCGTIKRDGLIMCHPGFASEDQTDAIRASRVKEYHYLAGDNFLYDCENLSVGIDRTNL
jgi:predicted glycoside hydrolase/deacetylase ChbG (UPF0249 family)